MIFHAQINILTRHKQDDKIFVMPNPNHHEAAPVDPVRPETAADLRAAVYQMAMTPVREGRKIDTATLTFDSANPRAVSLDFDAERPDSIGSGQVATEDESLPEFIAWAKTETGIVSPWEYGGETHIPYGYVTELTMDPSQENKVLSRLILPTGSGRVFEIDEGEYWSQDEPVIRELGEQDVQELLTTMQTAMSMPTVFAGQR